MSISKEDIKHIANLSRLIVTDEQIEKYSKDLSNIVDMASSINEVSTDNVKPTTHVIENVNVFRKDEVKPSYDREVILKNAPSKDAGCISVPKVVE